MCLRVELFEFFGQFFELFFEIFVTDRFAGRDADVATRIERPTLGGDLFKSGNFAQSRDIAVLKVALTPALSHFRGRGRKDFDQLGFCFVAAEREVEIFAAIKTDNVREKTDLRVGPISVRPVNLPIHVTGVDEKHFVGTGRALFAVCRGTKGYKGA